ncbi:MAG: hypothetical protein A2172_02430 [Candidatus Woykebacteria bacterium RBG_13_40_15]|uniref:Uncharacterized protein n=1 Tax=Candidatus Woykebacteria bacterium RBG_13_40_15 TaxID=1802593 RepID=A0A1G1W6E2_9BACT|nr:MAG: hypothetical protein A2172_02430 [Candidatus Woykebacteria bacterium RBG_13_40_15]
MRRFLVIATVLTAIFLVACGGGSDNEEALRSQIGDIQATAVAQQDRIDEQQKQIEDLQARVGGTEVGYPYTLSGSVGDLQGRMYIVEADLYTHSSWYSEKSGVEGGGRDFTARGYFDSLIAQAQQELAKGNVTTAEVLTHVAISSLGVTSCGPTSVKLGRYDLPADLVALVEDDLAPLYTFQKLEDGTVVIHWNPGSPGC